MARGIKWRMQFKSLRGRGCLVNIYEENYTSQADTTKTGLNVPFTVETGVTELIGAATPFTYEEDDSTDLLQFVRYKTGYIRVVEQTYGELNALNPSTITHHYVEVFYGNRRVFTGYMQCQQFDNSWVAAPRELSFPVISPLGLLSSFKFLPPGSGYADLGLTRMGMWMMEVLKRINPSATSTTSSPSSDYQSVVYPGTNYHPWDGTVPSVTMVPFNSDYKHYDSQESIYSPKDFLFYVEGVCACHGWIIHDTPDKIVFAQYDYSGYYSEVSVDGLVSLDDRQDKIVPPSNFPSISDYFDDYDDDALLSMVQPLKQVSIHIEGGEIKKKSLETELTYNYGGMGYERGSDNNGGWAARKFDYKGVDVRGPYPTINVPTFTQNGEISNYGLFPIVYGTWGNNDRTVSYDSFWVLHYQSGMSPLFAKRFYGIPPQSSGYMLLDIQMKRGTSLRSMQSTGFQNVNLNMFVRVGGKYWDNSTKNYSDSPTINPIVILGGTSHIQSNMNLNDFHGFDRKGYAIDVPDDNPVFDTVEIWIYVGSQNNLDTGDYLQIVDFSLYPPGRIMSEYDRDYNTEDIVRKGSANGIGEGEVTVNINNYIPVLSENTFGNATGHLYGSAPEYSYMFKPLYFLQERMKINNGQWATEYHYIQKWKHWTQGWLWRIISMSFDVRNDAYRITFSRSQTIES